LRLFTPESPHIAFLPPAPRTVDGRAGLLEAGGKAYRAGDHYGAFSAWKPLADKGNAEALFLVGTLFALGHGVRLDYRRAHELLHRAAANGDGRAAFNAAMIGLRKTSGRSDMMSTSVEVDMQPTTLLAYLRLAAEWLDDPAIHERVHRVSLAVTKSLPTDPRDQVRRVMDRISRGAGSRKIPD
jgi:hypothetical protein